MRTLEFMIILSACMVTSCTLEEVDRDKYAKQFCDKLNECADYQSFGYKNADNCIASYNQKMSECSECSKAFNAIRAAESQNTCFAISYIEKEKLHSSAFEDEYLEYQNCLKTNCPDMEAGLEQTCDHSECLDIHTLNRCDEGHIVTLACPDSAECRFGACTAISSETVCMSDAECLNGEICADGKCTKKMCVGDTKWNEVKQICEEPCKESLCETKSAGTYAKKCVDGLVQNMDLCGEGKYCDIKDGVPLCMNLNKAEACTMGSKICLNNAVYECQNNIWVEQKACGDNKCMAVTGDAYCSECENGVSECREGKQYWCKSGLWVENGVCNYCEGGIAHRWREDETGTEKTNCSNLGAICHDGECVDEVKFKCETNDDCSSAPNKIGWCVSGMCVWCEADEVFNEVTGSCDSPSGTENECSKCGDDEGCENGVCREYCDDYPADAQRCLDNWIMVCDGKFWMKSQDCGDENKCVSNDSVAWCIKENDCYDFNNNNKYSDGQSWCSGEHEKARCNKGNIEYEACPDNQFCMQEDETLATCNEIVECLGEERHCSGNTLWSCNNGLWNTKECGYCNPENSECLNCQPETMQCGSNGVEVCDDNKWMLSELCDFGCKDENGNVYCKCKEGSRICDDEGNTMYCKGGKYEPSVKCSSNQVCQDGECKDVVICGNNKIESGEVCDGSEMTQKCDYKYFDSACGTRLMTQGTLKCSDDCKSIQQDTCKIVDALSECNINGAYDGGEILSLDGYVYASYSGAKKPTPYLVCANRDKQVSDVLNLDFQLKYDEKQICKYVNGYHFVQLVVNLRNNFPDLDWNKYDENGCFIYFRYEDNKGYICKDGKAFELFMNSKVSNVEFIHF